MLKTYGKLAGHQVIAILLSVIFLVLLPIAMPAETYGQFSLVLSVAQIVTIVTLSWPNDGMMRYAREDIQSSGTFGGTIGARLGLHAVLLLIVVPLAWFFSSDLEQVLGVPTGGLPFLLVAFVVLSFNEMGQYAGQAVEKFAGYGLSPVMLRLAQVVALGGFALGWFQDWPALMVGTLIGYALGGAAAWWQIPRAAIGKIKLNFSRLKDILKYSWAVPFGAAGGVVVNWMDLWFLHHMVDDASVGVYAWAYNFSLLASAFLIPLSAMIAPRMIDMKLRADAKGTARYSRAAGAAYFLLIAILPMLFVPVLAIEALVGFGGYSLALMPLLILMAATSFQFASYLIRPVLVADPKLIPMTVIASLGVAIINGIGNYLLIPIFGVSGPALATAIAFAFGMGAQAWIVARYTDSDFPAISVLVIGGAAAIAAVAIPVFWGVRIGIPLCAALSVVMILVARKLGLFRGGSAFQILLEELPTRLRGPAVAAVLWLDNKPHTAKG